MEIVQVKQLSPGDRFALKDWMDKPQNRVVYRIPERPSDSVVAKRKPSKSSANQGGAKGLGRMSGFISRNGNNSNT